MSNVHERITRNPFYVLGLPPGSSRAEVEREGQKLLGMLKMSMRGATVYRTPLGSFDRTEELVRHALAELRDPDRRLVHEIWASRWGADDLSAEKPAPGPESLEPLEGLRRIFGW